MVDGARGLVEETEVVRRCVAGVSGDVGAGVGGDVRAAELLVVRVQARVDVGHDRLRGVGEAVLPARGEAPHGALGLVQTVVGHDLPVVCRISFELGDDQGRAGMIRLDLGRRRVARVQEHIVGEIVAVGVAGAPGEGRWQRDVACPITGAGAVGLAGRRVLLLHANVDRGAVLLAARIGDGERGRVVARFLVGVRALDRMVGAVDHGAIVGAQPPARDAIVVAGIDCKGDVQRGRALGGISAQRGLRDAIGGVELALNPHVAGWQPLVVDRCVDDEALVEREHDVDLVGVGLLAVLEQLGRDRHRALCETGEVQRGLPAGAVLLARCGHGVHTASLHAHGAPGGSRGAEAGLALAREARVCIGDFERGGVVACRLVHVAEARGGRAGARLAGAIAVGDRPAGNLLGVGGSRERHIQGHGPGGRIGGEVDLRRLVLGPGGELEVAAGACVVGGDAAEGDQASNCWGRGGGCAGQEGARRRGLQVAARHRPPDDVRVGVDASLLERGEGCKRASGGCIVEEHLQLEAGTRLGAGPGEAVERDRAEDGEDA